MEHLLNLLWLMVATVLFFGVYIARKRGELRCSVSTAVVCTLLLALVLFPALSMTDDLQRARMAAEGNGRGDGVVLRTLEDGCGHAAFAFVILATLLLLAALLIACSCLPGAKDPVLRRLRSALRPEAVRPPPAALFAC